MRERRLRVWKLGFQDFRGIDYINNPELEKKENIDRKYELKLPIHKITHINKDNNKKKKTFKRLFKKNNEFFSVLAGL